jgi:hypothetical protein
MLSDADDVGLERFKRASPLSSRCHISTRHCSVYHNIRSYSEYEVHIVPKYFDQHHEREVRRALFMPMRNSLHAFHICEKPVVRHVRPPNPPHELPVPTDDQQHRPILDLGSSGLPPALVELLHALLGIRASSIVKLAVVLRVLREARSTSERGTMFCRDVRLSVKRGESAVSLERWRAFVIFVSSETSLCNHLSLPRHIFWFGPTSIFTSSASPTPLLPPTPPGPITRYRPTRAIPSSRAR